MTIDKNAYANFLEKVAAVLPGIAIAAVMVPSPSCR